MRSISNHGMFARTLSASVAMALPEGFTSSQCRALPQMISQRLKINIAIKWREVNTTFRGSTLGPFDAIFEPSGWSGL